MDSVVLNFFLTLLCFIFNIFTYLTALSLSCNTQDFHYSMRDLFSCCMGTLSCGT